MAFALVLLIASPVMLFLVKNPAGMFRNVFHILLGIISWVGYYQSTGGGHPGLPAIRPGVLTPMDHHHQIVKEGDNEEKLNLLYAKDYRIINDMRIIARGYKQLGRKPVITAGRKIVNDKSVYGKI